MAVNPSDGGGFRYAEIWHCPMRIGAVRADRVCSGREQLGLRGRRDPGGLSEERAAQQLPESLRHEIAKLHGVQIRKVVRFRLELMQRSLPFRLRQAERANEEAAGHEMSGGPKTHQGPSVGSATLHVSAVYRLNDAPGTRGINPHTRYHPDTRHTPRCTPSPARRRR
jgi:hypothetical protein